MKNHTTKRETKTKTKQREREGEKERRKKNKTQREIKTDSMEKRSNTQNIQNTLYSYTLSDYTMPKHRMYYVNI